MPVYLCKPGRFASEPWRHGIQVYAFPFPIDDDDDDDYNEHHHQETMMDDPLKISTAADQQGLSSGRREDVLPDDDDHYRENDDPAAGHHPRDDDDDSRALPPQQQQQQQVIEPSSHQRNSSHASTTVAGVAIRRVRHAEVVLVDDVCIAYGRYWLRLLWPGPRGGFAGYIALGKTAAAGEGGGAIMTIPTTATATTTIDPRRRHLRSSQTSELSANEDDASGPPSPASGGDGYFAITASTGMEDDDEDDDDGLPPRSNTDDAGDEDVAVSPVPQEYSSNPRCVRTGLYFPSSCAMQLLAMYDDGLSSNVSLTTGSEPVFCRICREGVHDVEVDDLPSVGADEQDVAVVSMTTTGGNVVAASDTPAAPSSGNSVMLMGRDDDTSGNFQRESESDGREAADDDWHEDDNVALADPASSIKTGPIQPHPQYQPNTSAAENPLLAPCECSGSMAFVHYLCVEQWRCRSRHPEARNGLHCETCSAPYALPPPSSRPVAHHHHHHGPHGAAGGFAAGMVAEEDWLEAMPAHVLAALRQPHPWWQIGAAIVRRRWLRPIAPILMSPLVALYCRARRLLKKRGVSRRRWACSLCRRRARWKCVRCLRSYYCSRQCQNVSWHIVHKHVCYKPARFWWSVVVYGTGTVVAFPGILRDPLIYDLGLSLIPASFLVMGILGGGIATTFKKGLGIDLRGRTLELLVVLLTISLVLVSWGLVWAYFGDTSNCYGVFGPLDQHQNGDDDEKNYWILTLLRTFVFQPAQAWFLMWDRLGSKSPLWLRKGLCSGTVDDDTTTTACFAHLPKANPDFYFVEQDGQECASDLILVSSLWMMAGATLAVSTILKKRERVRRAAARGLRGPPPHALRPHQD